MADADAVAVLLERVEAAREMARELSALAVAAQRRAVELGPKDADEPMPFHAAR